MTRAQKKVAIEYLTRAVENIARDARVFRYLASGWPTGHAMNLDRIASSLACAEEAKALRDAIRVLRAHKAER